MSMIGILLRVTNNQLQNFLEDSSLFEEYIDSEEMENNENLLDLHKDWDALNYLLGGHSHSNFENAQSTLSRIIFSGQILDENQDLGYGPAQYLIPEQVKEVNTALLNISGKEVRQSYDAEKMNGLGIYPNYWEDNEEFKDFLVNSFNKLKSFYSKANEEGQAIITYIA